VSTRSATSIDTGTRAAYITDTGREFVLPLVSRTRLPDREVGNLS
jgi:hypothetical protein